MDVPARFWDIADGLVADHELIIDRPAGTAHPRFPDIIYPMDYGYLDGTTSVADGEGIDVWRGSTGTRVTAILAAIDLTRRDTEIKLLIGCTEDEIETIHAFHNQHKMMSAALVRR